VSVAVEHEVLVPVPEQSDRPSREGVVERVTQILDAFTDAPGRLLLEDITRITGLPRSTAFRILRQLVDQHWVEHDSRGYRLGPRLATFAARSCEYEDVRAAASVPLNELHLSTGAVAHLSVLEGGVVHYLDKIGGTAAASVPSRVGARIVASDTVSGRALLAFVSPEQVDAALASALRGREHTMDLAALHRELAVIRQRQGVAISPGERRRSGISSIAAPVLGPRGPVAAISLAVRGPLPSSTFAPRLLQATRVVSRNLFPEWAASQQARRRGQAGLRLA